MVPGRGRKLPTTFRPSSTPLLLLLSFLQRDSHGRSLVAADLVDVEAIHFVLVVLTFADSIISITLICCVLYELALLTHLRFFAAALAGCALQRSAKVTLLYESLLLFQTRSLASIHVDRAAAGT